MSGSNDAYLLGKRRTLIVFAGLLLGMLLAALNQTIVATALPDIVADLGGFDHYSWVFSAYMLTSTVTVPLYGKLSDVYGRRPFFLLAIVLFMLGAVGSAGGAAALDTLAGVNTAGFDFAAVFRWVFVAAVVCLGLAALSLLLVEERPLRGRSEPA